MCGLQHYDNIYSSVVQPEREWGGHLQETSGAEEDLSYASIQLKQNNQTRYCRTDWKFTRVLCLYMSSEHAAQTERNKPESSRDNNSNNSFSSTQQYVSCPHFYTYDINRLWSVSVYTCSNDLLWETQVTQCCPLSFFTQRGGASWQHRHLLFFSQHRIKSRLIHPPRREILSHGVMMWLDWRRYRTQHQLLLSGWTLWAWSRKCVAPWNLLLRWKFLYVNFGFRAMRSRWSTNYYVF